MPEAFFERLLRWTAICCEEATDETWLFCGRVVEMVDGWTLNMADSEENQEEYPQMASQKPWCGFPITRMIGLFCLATGAINFTAMAAYQGKQTGETSLRRTILDRILRGRILLADCYFASFWLLAMSELRNIDLVARAHHLRKVDFRRGLKQGYLDQIVTYQHPGLPSWISKNEYDQFPAFILVRHLRYKVAQQVFRTREVTLATTLLDAEVYDAENLASLYGRSGETPHPQLETSNEDGASPLSESADGSKRDPLPSDRLQLGPRCDAGFGVEVSSLSAPAELQQCDASVGRIRILYPPSFGSLRRAVGESTRKDLGANCWQSTLPSRTPLAQTQAEEVQTHANTMRSEPKPIRRSSLGLRPCHSGQTSFQALKAMG